MVATDHQTRPRVSTFTPSPASGTSSAQNTWNNWYACRGRSISPSGA